MLIFRCDNACYTSAIAFRRILFLSFYLDRNYHRCGQIKFLLSFFLDRCNGAIFSTRVIVLTVVYHGAGSVHLKMREARATHYFRLNLFWDERSQSEPAAY